MKSLADLSYRIKIPLAITTVIVLTEIVVTAALVTRAVADSRRDLQASAANLAEVLARSLRDPMLRDELWQAYEVIRAPLAARRADNPLHAIVVLDPAGHIFVSSDPQRLPVLDAMDTLPPALRALAKAHAADAEPGFRFTRQRGDDEFAALHTLEAEDGSPLGSVLLSFDAERERARVWASVRELALVSVPGMLLLIPLGWFWGKRMAQPLAQLAYTLTEVGRQPSAVLAASLPPARADEIGRLSQAARTMLDGLARKEALEREMLTSERLAAVGRASAAIAHEINNPLGGMLNADDTLQRHGTPDALTGKTLGLLQRGLQQVRATVGALLVEARLDSPWLSGADWQDLHTLVAPQTRERGLQLQWQVDPAAGGTDGHPVPLPAHQVRQLLLNLLLNAVKAADAGGVVQLVAERAPGALFLVVANTGAAIAPERLGQLFEPFVPAVQPDGQRTHGLGLWVCWQIVQQLHGEISAASDDGWTRFSVHLPVPDLPSPALAKSATTTPTTTTLEGN